jgi:hypothetical protein
MIIADAANRHQAVATRDTVRDWLYFLRPICDNLLYQ